MNDLSSPSATSGLSARVEKLVFQTPILDIHTHLYDPAFGELLLWGIDDLLTYHYLVAEAFRYLDIPYDRFWALSKTAQADLIWEQLFVKHSPISEACRGVLTTLNRLGVEANRRDLPALRKWFAAWQPEDYVNRCFELSNVQSVYMTNSPFDDLERPVWEKGFTRDERFRGALRIDPLLLDWNHAAPKLAAWGYQVNSDLTATTLAEIQRFLREWSQRIGSRFLMVSLPPSFTYPANTLTNQILEGAVLPYCRESNQPLALMMGVKRSVNPGLRMAGDGVGLSDLMALQNLCAAYQENRFMVTVLMRENQHELCVLARKFRNLHVFGHWWFMNVPSLIDEVARMRLELIGLSHTPQHSDARVLDQLIYKWDHTRGVLARVLTEKYADLSRTGWVISDADIQRDVQQLLGGAFETFCGPAV